MTTIRMTVPDGALDEDRRARLRTELGPAVLEVVGDGRTVLLELDESRNGAWGAGGDLDAEPGAYRSYVRVSVRPGQLDDLGRLVLADAVHTVVDGVLGTVIPGEATRSCRRGRRAVPDALDVTISRPTGEPVRAPPRFPQRSPAPAPAVHTPGRATHRKNPLTFHNPGSVRCSSERGRAWSPGTTENDREILGDFANGA